VLFFCPGRLVASRVYLVNRTEPRYLCVSMILGFLKGCDIDVFFLFFIFFFSLHTPPCALRTRGKYSRDVCCFVFNLPQESVCFENFRKPCERFPSFLIREKNLRTAKHINSSQCHSPVFSPFFLAVIS